jgi:predicted TIM-barrel fold metal-dependent hydrolase
MSNESNVTTTRERSMKEVIISADSHVVEPHDLWVKRLPARFKDAAPVFPPPRVGETHQRHSGGRDRYERVNEMAADGLSAEVLYPSWANRCFALEDPALQEACFQVYNDWIIDYCEPNMDRLVGIPCISVYNIDNAIKELERCTQAGLKGALLWQAPPIDLPFSSNHYEPFWQAAEALGAPINFHVNSGPESRNPKHKGPDQEGFRSKVNFRTLEGTEALFDLIFYGVLHRHPNLKFVIVENQIGWIPFVLEQWDYFCARPGKKASLPIDHEPSFYFYRQVYATFFNDSVGGRNLSWWGQNNCMWSSDFPHPNSSWPNSLDVIEETLGHLPPEARAKVLRENVVRLYGMKVPEPV